MRIRLVPGATLSLAAWLVVSTAQPAGQTPASPPPQAPAGQVTFKSTTSLVEVDVMVRDEQDKFVGGLTAADFDVFEDNKPQTIDQCYLVQTDSDTGITSVDGSVVADDSSQAHRVFVLVFDESDLDSSALARIKDGAERFLNLEFHEGDFGGVVVNGQLFQGKITRSRATLMAGVRAVKPAFDSRQMRLLPFRSFPRIPGEAEAQRLASGDTALTQQLAQQACTEDALDCAAQGGIQSLENKLQQKARTYMEQARDATRYTLESLQHVIGALAQVPGRKTIVFLSDGFYSSESTTELRHMAGMAARAGEAIYAVDGRGLAAGPPDSPDVLTVEAPIAGLNDRPEDGSGMLADGTGAFVIRRSNDFARALEAIAADTSTYYVVGYRPTNSAMDNKFRRIDVKAKRPGLRIRARTGYVASPLPQLINR